MGDGVDRPFQHGLSLLGAAFRVWQQEALRFVLFGAFMTFVVLISGQVPLLGIPLSAGLQGPLEAGPVYATLKILRGGRPDTTEFLGGSRLMAPLFLVSLLANMAGFVGLFLFVIPGLLISTWWLMAIAEMAVKPQASLWNVMQESGAKMKPVFFTGFLLVFIFTILEAVVTLPALQSMLEDNTPGAQAIFPVFLAQTLLTPIGGIAVTLLFIERSPDVAAKLNLAAKGPDPDEEAAG